MFKRTFTAAMVFGAAALAPPALAQTNAKCTDRNVLIEYLSSTYHESQRGAGLQSPERLLEIWSSAETGSFTIFITSANGISCVVATGGSWQSVPDQGQKGVAG